MKIVIDIPVKLNERLRSTYGHGGSSLSDYDDRNAVTEAIYNGIPLPKGHGRLIDADYIKLFSIDHDNWNGVEYEGVIKVVPVIAIDKAQTIIEADTEAENDRDKMD